MSRRAVLRSLRRHPARSADNRRRRLAVEALEDRRMLAVSSFQDGLLPSPDYSGTRDAPIFASDADVNFGDAVTLRADAEQSSTGQPAWTLIKWDLSSIPAGATVDEVTLTVNVTNTTVAPGFHLFEVKTPWLESEVTWNGPDANGTWEDPGLSNSVDAGEVILGTLPGTALGPLTISLTVEGLDLVQRWVNDPSSNHGFLLANADNTNSVRFDSREGTTPADRPMLSIDFDFDFVDIEPPTATLTFPEDNGPADQDDDLGEVRIGLRDRLEIQLSDYALDDVTVTTETVALTKDGQAVPDVAFSFDAATDLITLTPSAAPFPAGDYLIILNNGPAKIADTAGNQLPRTVFSIQFDNTLPTNPIARDDSYETDEDTPLVVSAENGVLWNDDDGNNPDFVPEIVEVPEHGRLTISEDGSFTYTPDEDYHGADRFRYQIGTQAPFVDRATVNIDVIPVNDAPVAAPDRFVAVQGETLSITLPSPSVSDPVRWRVEDGGNGNFYAVSTAQASWAEARDLAAASTFGGVSGHLITITSAEERSFAVANLPSGKYWIGAFQDQIVPDFSEPSGGWRWITGEPFSYTSWGNNEPNDVNGEDCAVADPGSWNDLTCGANDPGFLIEYEFPARHSPYGLLANDSDVDGDGLTVTLVDDVQHGTLVLSGDGTFQYTPEVGFVGVDTFSYQAGDGSLSSNLATVMFSVASISNTPPRALDDAYSVFENDSLNIDVSRGVLANDEDAEGDALVAIEVANPAHGTLTLSDDGSFSYAPRQDFTGTDSFTYRASDGRAESDVTTVTIEVLPVGEDAVAVDDVYTVNIDRVLTVEGSGVLFNDVHPTGEPLTASIFVEPEHGTVTLADDGSFVYTPDPGFEGTDTFTYRASDPSEANTLQLIQTLAYSDQQAPGVPGDTWFFTFSVPVINAVGQTAFFASLRGDNATAFGFGSVWLADADGTMTLAARDRQRAVGTSNTFRDFIGDPVLADSGHVAFVARTSPSGYGLWVGDSDGGLRLAVRADMLAPDTEPGTTLGDFGTDSFDLNDSGHVALLTGVKGPAVNDTNEVGIWAEDSSGVLRLIAREGDPAPGFGGVISFSGTQMDSFSIPSFNDAQQVAFRGLLGGFLPAFDAALWTGSHAEGLSVIAQEGMRAPGGSPGETLVDIEEPTSNNRGELVFVSGFSGGGEGLFVGSVADGLRLVARRGDPIPGTTKTIRSFGDFGIDDAGRVVFAVFMQVDTRPSGRALFVEGDDGEARLITFTGIGSQMPDTPPGTLHAGIRLPVINAAGHAAFMTSYSSPSRDAIVAEDTGGQSRLIVSEGQEIEVRPGDFRTIEALDFQGANPNSADRRIGFSGLGQVVFRALFTDDTSGVFVSNLAMVHPVSIATVTINVEPAPYNLPVALDDAFTTDEDTPLIVSADDGVLANDDDGDLPPLVAVLIDAPEHGEIALSDDGSFVYTPNANYFGADRFTYRITNTFTASEVATVTLGINSVNDAPVAQGDVYETLFGQPFISVGRGVLENDTDVEQQPLSALLQTQPQSGSLVWNGDGTFEYTPEAGFSGVERFTYVAFDGTAVSAETGVRIDVIRAPRIVGIVWHDRNTNGVIDAGEEPLPDRQQFLDLNVNRRFDSGEPTAVSGPDGQYRFDGLLPGTYFVGSLPPADWEITFPNLSAGTSLRHVVELQAGQSFNRTLWSSRHRDRTGRFGRRLSGA
ncbi:MAG: tandem-95 repeat protein [Planctomycetes bacterium]|nr:tandem-95 repeat protein [Planctomycetota bacterium]